VRSRAEARPIRTPHLQIAYPARDFHEVREMGASWQILTENTPELMGITPIGER
jgi:hypothetical protein